MLFENTAPEMAAPCIENVFHESTVYLDPLLPGFRHFMGDRVQLGSIASKEMEERKTYCRPFDKPPLPKSPGGLQLVHSVHTGHIVERANKDINVRHSGIPP